MIYVLSRDGEAIVVRRMKNNYVIKDGEAEVPGHLTGYVAGVLPGPGTRKTFLPLSPDPFAYRSLDEFTPDLSAEMTLVGLETDRLAAQVKMAVAEAAKRLRARGVTHSRLQTVIKYGLLRRLEPKTPDPAVRGNGIGS